ncbi:hypothetical protein [Devosia naphthalenivorans]|uniref:hypothetical protein n=1 Tax=Devosia naphthalenivorans TaxID=2082392 RepID=UPI000D3AE3BA|nr:hypothetical protein [Devosia naphthalenivorans]
MTTSFLKELGARIDLLVEAGDALVNEGPEWAVVSALSAGALTDVWALANAAGIETDVEDASESSVGSIRDVAAELEPFRASFRKPNLEPAKVLLTLSGLGDWLAADEGGVVWKHVQTVRPFSTRGRRFAAWGEAIAQVAVEATASPRDLVREAGAPTVPWRLEPWIFSALSADYPMEDRVFTTWATQAQAVALRCLASERLADGTLVYAGPPRLKQALVAVQLDRDILGQSQRALRWVYENEKEAEARHGLFVAEIPRAVGSFASNGGRIDARALGTALEGAKIAYQLSLSDVSRDALRGIADLRKAVSEEIGKVADTTRQLAAAVTGSLFFGLGLVAARLTTQVPALLLITLSLVLAAYVVAVIFASIHFMKLQSDLREDWKDRFYRFLGEADYETMVTIPMERAKFGFDVSAMISVGVSILLVIVVVFFSVSPSSPDVGDDLPTADSVPGISQ